MFKKFLWLVFAAVFVLAGCDSDNSTSASESGPKALSCSAKAKSDNTFIVEIVYEDVSMVTTAEFSGNLVNIEYDISYAPHVSASLVQQQCEQNKKDPDNINAQITCGDHYINIKETSVSETSFEETLESARNSCRQAIL